MKETDIDPDNIQPSAWVDGRKTRKKETDIDPENIHYAIAVLAGAVILVWTIKQNLSDAGGPNFYLFGERGFGVILTAVGVYLISKCFLIKKLWTY